MQSENLGTCVEVVGIRQENLHFESQNKYLEWFCRSVFLSSLLSGCSEQFNCLI